MDPVDNGTIRRLGLPHKHKWETIQSRKTCAICGLVSRDKIYVHDDQQIHCANYRKVYQSKKRPKK